MDEENNAILDSTAEVTPIKPRDNRELQDEMKQRLIRLKSSREPWLPQWKDSTDMTMPYKGSFIQATPDQNKASSVKTPKIYDNTATLNARTLSTGILSALMSPTKPWFQFGVGRRYDSMPDVKVWLEGCTRGVQDILHQSNFYEVAQLVCEDLVIFGVSVVLIYDDYEDVVRFYHLPVGTYMIGMDDRREVTILYEECHMTVYELVSKFGYDNVSGSVQEMYDQKSTLEKQIPVTHVIQRNKDFDPTVKGDKANEYIDAYFETNAGEGKFLSYKGFKEKPFCAVRWNPIGGDVYGSSPTMDVLSDIKQLQDAHKRKGQGIDRTFAPPMLADSVFRDQGVSLLPNAVNYIRNPNGIGVRSIYQGLNPNFSPIIEDIQDIRNRIELGYFKNLILMLDSMDGVQPRNQLEISERRGEKILLLEPMVHRMMREFIEIVLQRSFSVALRGGLFPQPPEALAQGSGFRVDYISQLATALKAAGTSGIEQFFAWVAGLAAVRPDVLDKCDVDEAVDRYAEMLNLSPKIIIPTEQANEMRDARVKKVEQQEAMQNGLNMAQGAKVLSDTNVGGGQNALTQMMGL